MDTSEDYSEKKRDGDGGQDTNLIPLDHFETI